MINDIKRILFLSDGGICYGSTICFIESIKRELEKKGYATKHIEVQGSDNQEKCAQLERILEEEKYFADGIEKTLIGAIEYKLDERVPYDVVLDINTKLTTLKNQSGEYYMDLLGGQVWHYILDHPFYHHESLVNDIKNFNVITVDYNHEKFVKEHYSNVKRCETIFLGADKWGKGDDAVDGGVVAIDDDTDAFAIVKRQGQDRIYDVIFTASYIDPDLVYLKGQSKEGGNNPLIFNRYVREALENPNLPQEEIMALVIRNTKALLENDDMDEINLSDDICDVLRENVLSDIYICAAIRQELMLSLIRAGVKVHLFGNNWDTFINKCEVLLNKSDIRECLIDHGNVDYSQLPEIYSKTKVVINQTPWFKEGVHDRVALAMTNGAICVTERNKVIERLKLAVKGNSQYKSENDLQRNNNDRIITYSLEELENVGEMVCDILKEIDGGSFDCDNEQLLSSFSWENWVNTWEKIVQRL